MANIIALQVIKEISYAGGYSDYSLSNKVISISTQQPYSVRPFSDAAHPSLCSIVSVEATAGRRDDYYTTLTVAEITTAADA